MTLNVLNKVVEFELQRKEQFQLLIEKTSALEKARDDQEKINKLLIEQFKKQHLTMIKMKKQQKEDKTKFKFFATFNS